MLTGKGERWMFAIGTSETKVSGTKLKIPKEYNLNKKDRRIYGLWIGVHTESVIEVPKNLDGKRAVISGRISTIKIQFQDREWEG